MRLLAILFLIIGVALAGGAVYYAMENLPQQRAANVEPQGPEMIMVVAAKRSLKQGDKLTYQRAKEVLKFVEWPKAAVPENAFFTAAEMFGDGKEETRTVLRAIEPGELILKSKVTGFGVSTRLSMRLSEGMRAVTIPISAITGTPGLISPGDRIDIQFIRRNGETLSSHLLLQNVAVIATGQSTDTERDRALAANNITVEVTTEQAQTLTIAMETGKLSLLLRGVEEVNETEAKSVDASVLPGAPEPEPEPVVAPVVEEAPKDDGVTVTVRRGTNESKVRFDDKSTDFK